MFKALGIIESFGTGIGEAKESLKENGSPEMYFKEFDNYNVTSVVIPVSEEYQSLKTNVKPNTNLGIEGETQVVKRSIVLNRWRDSLCGSGAIQTL
ncbi:MAG: hypothetical protein IJ128_04940, partial [Firmicutes bacterium]|nr:hypothetical protein [Bacillota bacterium]